ncbi:MAG: ABC transporter substrate-binding protein, partial [Thermomicrobiales bacterium]
QKDGDFGAAYLEENTVGTGPYKITESRPNERRVLERFEEYWQGWDGTHLSKIIFTVVPEAETRRQMLLDGEAQLIGVLASDTIKAIENEPGIKVNISPNFEIDIATLNTQKAPTDDVRVRKAIQLAFDYAGYRDSILLGYGRVPNGPMAAEYTGYNPNLPEFAQDLEAAKALIEEAGVSGQTISMNYVDGIAGEAAAGLIVQDSLSQIGLNVELRALPWATMFDIAGNQETADHISVLLMSTFTADPVFTLNQNYGCAFAGKPYNWSWYCNQDAQDLIDKAAQTLDEPTRIGLLQEAQALIVADAPVIWYSNPQAVEAVSTRIQNYTWNPVDYYWQVSWYDVWLAE